MNFAELDAMIDARKAWIESVIATRGYVPMRLDGPRDLYFTVTKDRAGSYAGKWRVTWFDRRGPGGHAYCSSYREAVRQVLLDGGKVESVTFPS